MMFKGVILANAPGVPLVSKEKGAYSANWTFERGSYIKPL